MSELPKEWVTSNIESLISKDGIFCDGDWIETEDQDPNGAVRLIQLADIGDGYFRDRSSRFLTTEKSETIGCTYLQKNDILVARMPDPLGRACIFPLSSDKKYVTAVDICIIRPNTHLINTKYLCYLINSPQMRAIIESYKSGTTRKRISRKNFAKILWPIAPAEEQHKISDLIEELFSDLDNAIENLKKAKEQLKVYRQAVLKYAFEGKLTNETVKQGELPKGWKLYSIKEVVKTIDGDRGRNYPKKNEFHEKGYCLFLSTKNVREGRFVFDENIFISKEKDEILRGGKLQLNDVVITTRGTLGNVALYDEKVPFKNVRINSGMLILRITNSILDNYFLMKFISSPLFNEQLKKKQSGTAQPQIPANVLREIRLPIPETIEKQRNIVAEIDRRLSVCDQMEETIVNGLNKAESLRQSILKQAFEGRLTEQWRKEHKDLITGENSAEALLKKIKAEKETLEAKSKGKKKHD